MRLPGHADHRLAVRTSARECRPSCRRRPPSAGRTARFPPTTWSRSRKAPWTRSSLGERLRRATSPWGLVQLSAGFVDASRCNRSGGIAGSGEAPAAPALPGRCPISHRGRPRSRVLPVWVHRAVAQRAGTDLPYGRRALEMKRVSEPVGCGWTRCECPARRWSSLRSALATYGLWAPGRSTSGRHGGTDDGPPSSRSQSRFGQL